MAGAQPVQNPAAGSGNPVPSPAQVLMDLTDKMTALLTAAVDPADQAQHDAEVAQLKLDLVKAKEDLAAEGGQDGCGEGGSRCPDSVDSGAVLPAHDGSERVQ